MSATLSYIILGISVLSSLLPLLIGSKQRRTLLWMYILAGFCADFLLVLLKRVLVVDYQWLSHIYILLEFLLISLYYRDKIFPRKVVFATVVLTGILFYLVTTFTGTSFHLYNVNGIGAAAFLLVYIAYSISGFYKILREQTIVRLEHSSFFWINTAFLIYAAGNIVVFVCIDYLLVEDKGLFYTLWVFKNTINVIRNVIFARALTLKE